MLRYIATCASMLLVSAALFVASLGYLMSNWKQSAPPAASHAHKPGKHGGTIVAIGGDRHHAEVVFEPDGRVHLHLRGADESEVHEVERQTLAAYAREGHGPYSAPFELKADPLPGDVPGRTSHFVGMLPSEVRGKKVEVAIPGFRIGGKRYHVAFASGEAHHDGDGHSMPTSDLALDDEQKLYLTPGGKYTKSDIQANGKIVASAKFKGVEAKHDLKPKKGDKICPITLTKANDKFTWIVGGKPYEFCCPPCVDEFVSLAKETPEEIKEPTAYVKK